MLIHAVSPGRRAAEAPNKEVLRFSLLSRSMINGCPNKMGKNVSCYAAEAAGDTAAHDIWFKRSLFAN
jgi:hypothetical protein